MPTWLAVAFLIFGLAGLAIGVGYRLDRRTAINRLAKRYGMERWPDESDEHLLDRIRDRIVAKGGRKW